MIRLPIVTALLTGLALPAMADCATSNLSTRCVSVGPGGSTAQRSADGRVVIGTHRPERDSQQESPRFFIPSIVAGVVADHILNPGDTLPEDGLIVMNPLRYGLPRPENGWTYFQVGEDIYRAEIQSRRVLNYVNPHINRRY